MCKSLGDIVNKFNSSEVEVISFDIFDTLLYRPIGRSSDVFELLDKYFSENNTSASSFLDLRCEAEAILRRQIISGEIKKEDITLTEIYDVLSSELYVDKKLCKSLKAKEIEVEKSLLSVRKSGKYLFDEAVKTGKTVAIISDMYLEKKTIEDLLKTNGIKGYNLLLVSSDCGKRKTTGNIYKEASRILGKDLKSFIHIGDNYESDVKIPLELGMQAVHFRSTREVFESHGCSHQVEKICSDLTNWQAAMNSVGLNSMRQMAANLYFDDPFREFEETSDYNNDPYFVGYAALGPELLALNKWIVENALRDKASKVIFLSRDGYMPKKIYDMYREYHPELPPSEYLHVSRRTVLPAMIRSVSDLFKLPIDITYQTPGKLLSLLFFCVRSDIKSSSETIWGFDPNEHFTRETYQKFISAFIANGYDEKKHRESVKAIGDYLMNNPESQVTDDAVLFDMGYSGRIAAAITYATGLKPVSYYFHASSREHFKFERKSDIKIRAFFDFNPYMESSLREYSFLEAVASPVSYGANYEVKYDAGPAEGYSDTALAMQDGASDFARDYMKHFAEYERETEYRSHDAAMPFEAFIRYCSEYDRKMYSKVLIDDELWGGRRDINIRRLMEARLSKLPEYAKEKN